MAVKLCGDECEVVLADEMERPFQADGNSVMGNEEASLAMKSLLGHNKEFELHPISNRQISKVFKQRNDVN